MYVCMYVCMYVLTPRLVALITQEFEQTPELIIRNALRQTPCLGSNQESGRCPGSVREASGRRPVKNNVFALDIPKSDPIFVDRRGG